MPQISTIGRISRVVPHAAAVALIAGSLATIGGCGGRDASYATEDSESTLAPTLPTPTPPPDFATVPAWDAEKSFATGRLNHARQPGTSDDPYAMPSSGEFAIENDHGSDAWGVVEAATYAERFRPELQTVTDKKPSGPNMASQLYGELLGTEIPGTGEFQGQHTVNIRQISFTNDGSDFDPQVSRDGRRLVFASTQHTPTADVYIKDVGSRVLTRLTDDPGQDVMPTISPDGTRIAFTSNRTGSWDIWVMPVNGGKAIQVTSGSSNDLHPSWSPDGQQVVFCRLGQTSGRWELWVADVYDNAATQFIGYGLFPEWCPKEGTGAGGADQILFQRSRERGDRTFAIWTIDFDRGALQAGRETQIASDPDFALINPAWSPAGDRIAYGAVPNPDEWIGSGVGALPPSAAIWMVGVDGRGEVPLTSGASIDLMPTWSSAGQVIFVSNRSGVENLWSVDMAPALLAATGISNSSDDTNFARNRSGQGQDSSFVSVPTDE